MWLMFLGYLVSEFWPPTLNSKTPMNLVRWRKDSRVGRRKLQSGLLGHTVNEDWFLGGTNTGFLQCACYTSPGETNSLVVSRAC